MPSYQLCRFHERFQDRLAACASLSDRVGQLAQSHPPLFFALATEYGSLEARMETIRRAELGFPLREVCEPLGMPLAFRRIEPELLHSPLPEVELSHEAARALVTRIQNHEDVRIKAWLFDVTLWGTRMCHEDFGLWLSAQSTRLRFQFHPQLARAIALAVWCQDNRVDLPDFMAPPPWTPGSNWRGYLRCVGLWLERMKFFDYFYDRPLSDPWVERGSAGGFEFVPLCSAVDLIDEARHMQNCLAFYADAVNSGTCRLISVRSRGARVGTAELRPAGTQLTVVQMKGPRNVRLGLEPWHAIHEWLESQCQVERRLPVTPHAASGTAGRFAALMDRYLDAQGLKDVTWRKPSTLEGLSSDCIALMARSHAMPCGAEGSWARRAMLHELLRSRTADGRF